MIKKSVLTAAPLGQRQMAIANQGFKRAAMTGPCKKLKNRSQLAAPVPRDAFRPLRAFVPENSLQSRPSPAYWGNRAMLRLSRTTQRIQTKLQIGAANDPLEAEADQVADRVMRMTDANVPAGDSSSAGRRMTSDCKRNEGDKQQSVQRKSASVVHSGGPAPQSVHQVLNSPGRPLAAPDRAFFEPRLGTDLSAVRIHDDSRAADSARSIRARAYTLGSHIAFADRMDSASHDGRHLLAHELAHTVQQNGQVRREMASGAPDPLQNPPAKKPAPRPASAALWSAYDKVSYFTMPDKLDVWKFIGGSVGQAFHKENSCAARVSYALNYGGFPVPTADNVAIYLNNPGVSYEGKAGDGMKYIVQAPRMEQFLQDNFGTPDATLTTVQEASDFDNSLRKGQVAIFAAQAHSGFFYNTDYYDPHIKAGLPMSVWRMA